MVALNKFGITYADLVRHLSKPKADAKEVLLCIIKENKFKVNIAGLNNRGIVNAIADHLGLSKVDGKGNKITDAEFDDIEDDDIAEEVSGDVDPATDDSKGDESPDDETVGDVLTATSIRRMKKDALVQLAIDNKIPYKRENGSNMNHGELCKAIIAAAPWETEKA